MMTRRPGAVAAVVFVAAVTWVATMGWLVARWPAGPGGALAAALVGSGVAVGALALGRRWPHERDRRALIADRVLVASLAAVVAVTVFCTIVLALIGRPDDDALDAVRACLVAAIVLGVVVGPAVRRAAMVARRVVYGSDGPRHELLDQFARQLAGATALDDVLLQLVETVRPACAADAGEVWLRRDGTLELVRSMPARRAEPLPLDATRAALVARAGVSGDGWAGSWLPDLVDAGGRLRVAPLAVQGELLGVLVARRRAERDDFDDADDESLARVVRLVAAALQNAELDAELRRTVAELRRANTELRASRARLVSVADDERRRLERDLHDGAQSHLAAVAVKVQLARALARTDPDGTARVLGEIEHDVATANVQLRDLAHGIFPLLLLTGGLRDALAGIAAHAPAAVEVGDVTAARYDRQVEAAVYFCCAEAVHNAVKHAGPGAHVVITVHDDGAVLTLTVRDDGPGIRDDIGDGGGAGQGLTNMADRLGALGGTLEVHSNGDGTTVRGTVPLGQRESSAR